MHPLMYCLYQVLEQSWYNIELQALKSYTKYYKQCAKYSSLIQNFFLIRKITLFSLLYDHKY